ncbi:MAG: hypothetical protein LBS83_02115 [Holosporales bacterium]|jgi:hypothetical protein|nr:hypothetical protein [Holosporales bacterium]
MKRFYKTTALLVSLLGISNLSCGELGGAANQDAKQPTLQGEELAPLHDEVLGGAAKQQLGDKLTLWDKVFIGTTIVGCVGMLGAWLWYIHYNNNKYKHDDWIKKSAAKSIEENPFWMALGAFAVHFIKEGEEGEEVKEVIERVEGFLTATEKLIEASNISPVFLKNRLSKPISHEVWGKLQISPNAPHVYLIPKSTFNQTDCVYEPLTDYEVVENYLHC